MIPVFMEVRHLWNITIHEMCSHDARLGLVVILMTIRILKTDVLVVLTLFEPVTPSHSLLLALTPRILMSPTCDYLN